MSLPAPFSVLQPDIAGRAATKPTRSAQRAARFAIRMVNSITSSEKTPENDTRLARLGQSDQGAEAAFRAVGEDYGPAMRQYDAARDGEAEAGAAGIAVARFLQPHERAEDVLDAIFRDAGAGIVDGDLDRVGQLADRDLGAAAVADRVLHQVVEAAPQGNRPRAQGARFVGR